MANEEIEKEITFAKMVVGVIENVKTPMLIYQEEKDVTKKALLNYIEELESSLRGR